MDTNLKVYDNNSVCKDFQNEVSKSLIRHKSILDIMTKLDEYNARINRAVAKSVTSCGCISIDAKKQNLMAIPMKIWQVKSNPFKWKYL